MKNFAGLLLVLACTLIIRNVAAADAKSDAPGITPTEIKIGQTMPYSGPLSSVSATGRAELAYFRMLNDKGGINGRRIVLLSLDDGYSPPKTIEQTRKLVEQEKVAFIFSTFGAPTNIAIQRYLNQQGIPQLLINDSASRWNDPQHFPWTMGLAFSEFEGRLYGRYLVQEHQGKIAVLYENDDSAKNT